MFESKYERLDQVDLPQFSGIRVMMMPFIIGDVCSLPVMLGGWIDTISRMLDQWPKHRGETGYITIDEGHVKAGATLRRTGKHVDGVFEGKCGGWGGGGGWGSVGNGMLTASSPAGCKAWRGSFDGFPGDNGECDHMADQCRNGELFEQGRNYWVDGLCVHESVPMERDTDRQFIRLSMPSAAPWFDGYTANPLGVKPTGPILPRRVFMDAREGK